MHFEVWSSITKSEKQYKAFSETVYNLVLPIFTAKYTGVIVLTMHVCVRVCVCHAVYPFHAQDRMGRHADLNFGMLVKWKYI